MKVSLIVVTYNWKESLRLSIESALEQTRMLDEIVIADDGSREDTATMIREMQSSSPIPLLHAWHPDDGYRAAAARNNGIAASSGDYLIFLDGDCFVNQHFVADHLALARPQQYIVGTRVNILPRRQRYIFATGNRSISFFSWGTRKKFNAIRSPWMASFYHSTGGMASANFSAWRDDIFRVNGFDEWFVGYCGEDGELAIRLGNAGIARRKMVHLGMAYHLAHSLRQAEDMERIWQRFAEAARTKKIRCEQGLEQRAGVK